MEKSNDVLMPEIERLLNSGHIVEFVPRGVSMRPFIEGGADKVVVKRSEGLYVGTIVLAKVNSRYVLHRIYKIKGKQIMLRGDGNLSGFEMCSADDILGCVVRICAQNGKRKCVNKAYLWRHLPVFARRICMKIYCKMIQ